MSKLKYFNSTKHKDLLLQVFNKETWERLANLHNYKSALSFQHAVLRQKRLNEDVKAFEIEKSIDAELKALNIKIDEVVNN